MQSRISRALVAALALSAGTVVFAADMPAPVQAAEIKWGPAPAVLPPGAQVAVLAGDPASKGLVIVRLKMPAGYEIPAHTHPSDEHVTIISGTFGLGMGDKLDRAKSKVLRPGGYAAAPAGMSHFAWTASGAVVEIALMGPFAINYVNPADDPSKKK